MADEELLKRVDTFTKDLASCVRIISVYGNDHVQTINRIEQLFKMLQGLLKDRDKITIGVLGQELAFEAGPLDKTSHLLINLAEQLKRIKIEKMTFTQGVDYQELTKFIKTLSEKFVIPQRKDDVIDISEFFTINHILVGQIGFKKDQTKTADAKNELVRIYNEGLEFMKKTLLDLASGKLEDVKHDYSHALSAVRNIIANEHLMFFLNSTRSYDAYTFLHNINVMIFTMIQAQSLGFKDDELTDVALSALFHDLGKLSVPEDILKSPDKLTDDQMRQISRHPVDGAKKLLLTDGIPTVSAVAAFEHQMQYNMKGYPQKLYGRKINLVSMMITIADCYEALRSKRPYRDAMKPEEAYKVIMKDKGTKFHPELLDHFFSVIGMYPSGTMVELDTGEVGIVVKLNDMKAFDRPFVELLYESGGGEMPKPVLVNLLDTNDSGKYKRSVKGSILPSEKYKLPEKYSFQ